jgi:hypothetical protein
MRFVQFFGFSGQLAVFQLKNLRSGLILDTLPILVPLAASLSVLFLTALC